MYARPLVWNIPAVITRGPEHAAELRDVCATFVHRRAAAASDFCQQNMPLIRHPDWPDLVICNLLFCMGWKRIYGDVFPEYFCGTEKSMIALHTITICRLHDASVSGRNIRPSACTREGDINNKIKFVFPYRSSPGASVYYLICPKQH